MNCSTPGFLVLHYLLEFAQTHVHWISDAIQPYHPVTLFSCPQSFTASVLPMNILGWFPLGLTGLISLQSKGLSRVFFDITVQSINSSALSLFLIQLSHMYMTTRKTVALTIKTFVDKVMSLLFIMLSRFVIAFLPRSKHLSILWLKSPSAVIWEPKKMKSVTAFIFSPPICHEVYTITHI